jgi:hypothetical protein
MSNPPTADAQQSRASPENWLCAAFTRFNHRTTSGPAAAYTVMKGRTTYCHISHNDGKATTGDEGVLIE